MTAGLLRVEDLAADRGGRRVLEGVSFTLDAGEVLGVIGESGSGKSTLARSLLRLIEPARGHAYWKGKDLFAMQERELRQVRRDIQIVFQDPAASFDPRMTVGSIVAEPLEVHRLPRGRTRVLELLQSVELGAELLERHPHELSAGQAQRVALARALATRPSLLIADEAFSALDVSLQAQMSNLVSHQRATLGIGCLFITHDLRLAAHLCDRIAVLAAGSLVEIGTPAALIGHAAHAGTRALVEAARG